jgi:plasmid rolling circle replication initiator protein Rep
MTKFNELKAKNQPIENFSKTHLSETGHGRLCKCWNTPTMATDFKKDKFKVLAVESCNKRCCAICSTRNAFKTAMQLSVMTDYIHDEYECEYIFKTFSAKSVKGEDLPGEVDNYNKAVNLFYGYKDIRAVDRGTVRKLEITYNSEKTITEDMWYGRDRYFGKSMADYFTRKGLKIGDLNPNYDTYHLHVHALMAVDKHYFKDTTYIKQEKWLKLWQRAMRDPTITHFHVQRFRPEKEKSKNMIHELAKYTAKPSDMGHSQEVFSTIYTALYKRKLITYSGHFKNATTEYKGFLKAYSKGEEKTHKLYKYFTPDTTEYYWLISYNWSKIQYDEKTCRELTAHELTTLERRDYAAPENLEE